MHRGARGAIVAGILELALSSYLRAGEPWTVFIPLVGGFIWAGTDPNCCGFAAGLVFGGIGSGLQSLGLLFMVIGALARETTVVAQRTWGASLEPELVGGPGEAGLGLRWRF